MTYQYFKPVLFSFIYIFSFITVSSQTNVGSGSYTTTFPGTDSAGRNSFPSGSPQVSGDAMGKPVPTNDWWSKMVKENHADNLFNYPMTMKTINQGLVTSYIPWGVIDDQQPIIVGVQGLNESIASVSDFSDWTVTMNWGDRFSATSGIGMPFIYFEKGNSEIASITINLGTVNISGEMITIIDARNGGDFAIYAPTGSTWVQNGNTYTSTLNGKNYWSMAMLPQSNSNVATVANEYKKYAYVFPTNTTASWSFNETTSKVTTTFTVSTDVKEGTNTNMLLGLLTHQWANLSSNSATPNGYSYDNVRGEIKTLDGNSFVVENTFKGILPTLPNLVQNSASFSLSDLNNKISQIENDALSDWTDSYNEGQVMNRLIQTARVADQMGDIEARDKMIATVKERLEDWLKYQSGEVAFLFYYNDTWSSLLGYPSGHGQDSNINDHHFHWGYFIHAAAFMEQFEPGWVNQWGDMINLLVRDAASSNRDDSLFPFLRNFSPYAGHSWANGFATFPQGNDQESTSESMQFASSLIHWGSITENDDIRDLGIYIYTTEQTAIEEYWFDMNDRVFQPNQQYSLVSRVWGNSYDNGTFWTSDITASYVIELYPIHGGSTYLGHDTNYVQTIWNELKQYTGILNSNDTNPNLWHDTIWKYLSFLNPQEAINLYNGNPDRTLKFGVSDAQTYYWLHSMNAVGQIDSNITADYPIAVVFSNNGDKTYVAHNYSDTAITVNFSDGFQLNVPANSMATNKDLNVGGTIFSDRDNVDENENVQLSLAPEGSGITKVEFYENDVLLGEDNSAPFQFNSTNLSFGVHNFYAKIYVNTEFNFSNVITVQVGDQIPYLGNTHNIPGTIQAGHYDSFEGGNGQNISYFDSSQDNQGDFRSGEYVDAITIANEGDTVGWITAGEWLEYTIDVQTTGCYDLNFRYASGNSNGGGPFYFEVNGERVSSDITVSSSGDWNNWNTQLANLNLTQGVQVLRLAVTNGEFNIGEMTFSYNAAECSSQGGDYDFPFDFENTPTTSDFSNFDGGTATVETISSPQSNGNSSLKLAKIVRNEGQPWSGAYLNLSEPLNFASNGGYITMKVWTEAPIGTPMQIKLEQQSGSAFDFRKVNTTISGGWETLSWDFSSLGASSFDRLVFMFDIDTVGDGSNTSTFYFDDVNQQTTLSTDNIIKLNSIVLFPNPVKELLHINSNSSEITKVEIFTLLGQKVLERGNTDTVNLRSLSKGVYLIKVHSNNAFVTKKLIKE